MAMKDWKPKEIKLIREDYHLSQATLGALLGVSRNHIYYLERGERIPSKTLQLLLDYVEKDLRKGGEPKRSKQLKRMKKEV
ncbi:MAG: helix-turn-helix transcriptional regulator [Thermodesulfovibrionia bacterium]|nr:helix-turn-helix transcriptional regulator [Thermodesulfovibrionia bacterium]